MFFFVCCLFFSFFFPYLHTSFLFSFFSAYLYIFLFTLSFLLFPSVFFSLYLFFYHFRITEPHIIFFRFFFLPIFYTRIYTTDGVFLSSLQARRESSVHEPIPQMRACMIFSISKIKAATQSQHRRDDARDGTRPISPRRRAGKGRGTALFRGFEFSERMCRAVVSVLARTLIRPRPPSSLFL